MATRSGSLSPQERRLFALYAQYPNIAFEPETSAMVTQVELDPGSMASAESASPQNSQNHQASPSSPSSSSSSTGTIIDVDGDGDEANTTEMSGTTANTTPLRDLGSTTIRGQTFRRIGTAEDEGTLEHFLQLVETKSVFPEMQQSFNSFGIVIANIGQDLFPIDPNRPLPHIDDIYARCKILLRGLIEGNLDITDQREKVAYLKSLRAFNIDPPDEYVWTIFKQRAELIFKTSSCPRKREKDLLDALVVLFHIQLYGPFMDFIEVEGDMEERFIKIYSAMFDKITAWLSLYCRWWDDMLDLKERYTVPLWRRICASEEIQAEIREEHELRVAGGVSDDVEVVNWLND